MGGGRGACKGGGAGGEWGGGGHNNTASLNPPEVKWAASVMTQFKKMAFPTNHNYSPPPPPLLPLPPPSSPPPPPHPTPPPSTPSPYTDAPLHSRGSPGVPVVYTFGVHLVFPLRPACQRVQNCSGLPNRAPDNNRMERKNVVAGACFLGWSVAGRVGVERRRGVWGGVGWERWGRERELCSSGD